MAHPDPLDAAVIGGGPAGLTAATYLGRFRRRFRVFDAGDSRAAWIPLSRNHPGFPEGVTGADLLARMRAQAARYGAEIEPVEIERVAPVEDGFRLEGGGRTWTARTVLLASGVADNEPALPGVEAAIRRGLVRICPICDGYEMTGRPVAVIGDGDPGAREALFLAETYSDRVSLIHTGPAQALPAEARAALAARRVEVIETGIEQVRLDNDRLEAMVFEGRPRRFDAVYAALGVAPRSELAARLGAGFDPQGRLVVDDHQQTSVPGLYAAGDLVRGLNQISTAEGEAAVAATAIHNHLREAGLTPVKAPR